ncbi:MAG: AraC family transcriptional regulator [Verrucomicrobiaceae bacterium]|nr:MAG: AraC family transcriptional regulator [Verrucomicrobiaceae bacterium]
MEKGSTLGKVSLRLFDPRHGDAAFKLEHLDTIEEFSKPQRSNCFTVLWFRMGKGQFHADLSEYSFAGPALLFLSPYQTFFLAADSPLHGVSLQFHANFFCIETHHEAVGCNGVLFNDIYGQPLVPVDGSLVPEFEHLLAQMELEFRTTGLAHTEALVSYLKLFLIKATRLKLEQQQQPGCDAKVSKRPAVLDRLIQMIEEQYHTLHSPADYASALNMSSKALGKLVKDHLGKTLTELIRERLLKHAKWQLLHTRRPVKEIAWEMGFADELYFSRVFRRGTGCSPSSFREFETAIRGGRNLSM